MKLDALFELGDAAVTFHTAKPTRFMARRVHPLEPKDFLFGRPRARDRVPESEVRPRTRPATPRPPRVWPGPPPQVPREETRREEPPKGKSESSSPRRGGLSSEARRRALEQLGLPSTAGEEEVRRAFRKLAVELHPDRHVRSSAAERDRKARKFAEVSAAYHALVA
jgi:hypothetical protein